jgi:DNA replicative helicase MCM subunit Mcm2 (Cdc46/Mcm family)
MSRRITENSGRHITVRQLESTVRLAQGKSIPQKLMYFHQHF